MKQYAIQICDGEFGCGRIIKDEYEYPQRCDWTKHEHQPKYRNKLENAPLMRKTIFVEFIAE